MNGETLISYTMKTYLEIKVPIKYEDSWFRELRTACYGFPVRWQKGYYHITLAFCDDTPIDVDLRPILEKHLGEFKSPVWVFDKLDAFISTTGTIIVYLGVGTIPDSFLKMVDEIRVDLSEAGCVILSDFKLHVTLGRFVDTSVSLSSIQNITKSISLPCLSLKLTNVTYRVFRGRVIYETILK